MKIGVLIIGSLYWDEKRHRRKWRRERLHTTNKQYVQVPIRYGRLSSKRNSYTMVFSTALCDKQLGQAIVVPCKGEALIEEAECLWTAERTDGKNRHKLISAKDGWGCIALLKNPDRSMPNELHDSWTKRVFEESKYRNKIISTYDKEVVIDKCGFLKIKWPKTVDGSDLNYDALLTAVTCPTLENGIYPLAQDVAKKNRCGEGRNYFCNNRKHKIKTFQDADIICCWAKNND